MCLFPSHIGKLQGLPCHFMRQQRTFVRGLIRAVSLLVWSSTAAV